MQQFLESVDNEMTCFITVVVSLPAFFGMLYVLWDYFNDIPTYQIRRQYVIYLLKSHPILFALLTVNLTFDMPIQAFFTIILSFLTAIIIDSNNVQYKRIIEDELRFASIGTELQNILLKETKSSILFFWILVSFSIGFILVFTVLVIIRFVPILQSNDEYIFCGIIAILIMLGHIIFFTFCILQFFNHKETVTIL
ncbi:MAG: hypothetical protein LBU34_09315 [Planctomycetaceae bacterium]|jgi:hypothetical protein|nr:hypothetical protein [Planctomycetaceae bacterium]